MKVSVLLAIPLMMALVAGVLASEVKTGHFSRPITKTVSAGYALYLPDGYDPKSKKLWPMILFLHGMGDRGDDLSRLTDSQWSPLAHAKKTPGFPFIVAAPQSPASNDRWTSDIPIATLKELLQKYRVDPDRVYLTGVSMGGAGAWRVALDYPKYFAAMSVVSGSGYPDEAGKLVNMPIWVFHGAKDNVVPLKKAQDMVDAVKAKGAKDVKMTVYPDMAHDAWEKAYSDPDMYDWFLTIKKNARH